MSRVSRSTGVGAAERIHGIGDPRLVGEDLLGAQRDAHGRLGGQRERLVHRVGVERLAAAEDRGERLDGDAHDVVLRLLGGQRAPRRLGMEAQHPRARVPGLEALAHDARPQPAGRPELGDLLEEVVVGVEEERQLRREVVDLLPRIPSGGDVRDAVGQGERDLLHRRAARLADVIAGDRDRVPARHALPAEGERVGDQPHGRRRREDVGAAGDVFLQDVVLHGAARASRTARPGARPPRCTGRAGWRRWH